jgi:hypothetical protein
VIEDVLMSAQVNSTVASHAEIATAIMDAFAVCHIFVTMPAEREAAANSRTSAPSPQVEDLTYTIDERDAAGNVVEVLGREHSVLPAPAAYLRYVESHPDKLIVLCEKMRMLERSDRKDG